MSEEQAALIAFLEAELGTTEREALLQEYLSISKHRRIKNALLAGLLGFVASAVIQLTAWAVRQ